MGAIVETLWKESHMGGFHSRNVLCGGLFAWNTTYKVEDVAIRESSKRKVDNEEENILLWSMEQVSRMVPKSELVRTVMVEEKEMVQPCWTNSQKNGRNNKRWVTCKTILGHDMERNFMNVNNNEGQRRMFSLHLSLSYLLGRMLNFFNQGSLMQEHPYDFGNHVSPKTFFILTSILFHVFFSFSIIR